MSPLTLQAGAAAVDITPKTPQFLHGYPHVQRTSTGVHDPLLASALALHDGQRNVVFVGCDIIFVPKDLAMRARARIADATGVSASNIIVTATHTHSGPVTVNCLSSEADPIIPKADAAYLRQLEQGIVDAACQAWHEKISAEAGLVVADGRGLGTNRHDPAGPADPRVPVLLVRAQSDHRPIGLMLCVSMHPTVLHEDSTQISGDFPGLARLFLQQTRLGNGCPVVYHIGAAGNQSPRHVTRANTFAEAKRLGELLGASVIKALEEIEFTSELSITCQQRAVNLPARSFPNSTEAALAAEAARQRLTKLRQTSAPRTQVRTAECDWFGAEETLTLARAAENGRLQTAIASVLPAEIQVVAIGPWTFVAWPGEVFVEFGLAAADLRPETFIITLANGELQGYLVTGEAVEGRYYEAGNALFASPESGERLLQTTRQLLGLLPPR